MKVSATLKNLRITPRKVRIVTGLIKNLNVDDAIVQLNSTIKRSCPDIKKLLNSAIANCENNFGLDRNNLFIFEIIVNEGKVLKRWMPKAYGRAGRILKRTSMVTIILSERIEGKNRKNKEQIEKEKKERAKAKENEEKRRKDERIKEKKDEKIKDTEKQKKKPAINKNKEFEKKEEVKKSWTSKIFRRKSM